MIIIQENINLNEKGMIKMELILKQDVKGLGKKGDKVKTSDGYARNFLLPKGIAVELTKQAEAELKGEKAAKEHKKQMEIEAALEAKNKIDKKTIKFQRAGGKEGKFFGSITAKDVAEIIKTDFAVDVDKRKIQLPEIKSFGTFKVEIKLYPEIFAEVFIAVSEK
ncbi:MAG: 50S ribosomal protein L9 [Candidatus Fimenecus sp.]